MKAVRNIARSVRYQYRKATASRRALPEFMIIGTQKGGTSSMLHYLSQHPSLGQSYSKEPHYFDDFYAKGQGWYQAQFPPKEQGVIYGEATPYYLFFPFAAERIKKDFPDTKLIILLRNPIDRAFSHFQMTRKKQKETLPTFEDAISQEAERTTKEWVKQLQDPNYSSFALKTFTYLKRGEYADQLTTWYEHFSKDQILVLCSEYFFENPMNTLEKVYKFLGVDHFQPADLKPRLRGNYAQKIELNTQAQLQEYFQSHNEKLWTLLGEKFPW